MKNYLKFVVLLLSIISTLSYSAPGRLFTATLSGKNLTITPTVNHYYPTMGIKLSSGQTLSNCTSSSNGYCLFSASKSSPKVLQISGTTSTSINGSVCLSGPAKYSCQKLSFDGVCSTTGGKTCRVFVTSKTYQSDFGGIAAGDSKCQQLADNENLGGTWKAWLSDSNTNARDNIMYNSAISYIRAGDEALVAGPGLLLTTTTNDLSNAINLNEKGVTTNQAVWTGTAPDGTSLGTSCSNWKQIINLEVGVTGNSAQKDSTWTNEFLNLCSAYQGLLYFEKPTS